MKPGGLFAVAGYTLTEIPDVDDLFNEFYNEKVGEFWDPERLILTDKYRDVPFPFPMQHAEFDLVHNWDLNGFLGYLKTWSAVKHYETKHGANPVDEWADRFAIAWGDQISKKVVTPYFLLTGRAS